MRALDVRCPTCGAHSGEGCVSVQRGLPQPKPHRQRDTRARLEAQGRRIVRRQRRRVRQIPESVRIAVFSRALGQCEAAGVDDTPCQGRMHYHHVLRRSQGGADTVGNLVYVCATHHARIHAFPAWAYSVGLLRRRAARKVA